MILLLKDRFSKALSMVSGYILLVCATTFGLASTFHDVSRGNQICNFKERNVGGKLHVDHARCVVKNNAVVTEK